VTYTWNSLIFAGCCRKGAPLSVAGRCVAFSGRNVARRIAPRLRPGRFLLEPDHRRAMIRRPRLFSVAWAARQARLWLDPSRLPGPRSILHLDCRLASAQSSRYFFGFFGIFLARKRWVIPTISSWLLGSQIQKAVDSPRWAVKQPDCRHRSLLIVE
jgi:hypothetical protein